MNIVSFRDVSVERDGRFLLKNLNLDISSGVITVVLGSEESGLNTMVNLLAGLERQGVGDISIYGLNIFTDSAEVNRQTGFVLRDSELYEAFSASENIQFYADLYGMEEKETYERMAELMRRLSLWKQRDTDYGRLSSSDKIKLRLVRALIHSPSLLIVDDVLKSLDNESLREVSQLFSYLISEEKMSILIFTDNPDYSFGADEYVIMINGSAAVSGPYAALQQAAHLKSRAVIQTLDGTLNLPAYEVSDTGNGVFEILIEDKREICEIIKSAVLFNNSITGAGVIDRTLSELYSALLERRMLE